MLTQYLASLKNLYHLIKNGLQDHSCGLNSFFRFFFHEEWRVVGKKNNPAKCCNELRGGIMLYNTFFPLHPFVPIRQRHLIAGWTTGIFFPGPTTPYSCCSGICKERQAEEMV